jgi:ribosome-associated heat shock protein Hsp15
LKPTKTVSADPAPPERQRVDKWMWHARLVRTRSDAAELAGRGHVRVNGERISAASRKVGRGDVLTVVLGRVRVVKVTAFAERRGDAQAAKGLYEDLEPFTGAPSPASSKPELDRSPPGPRPTKRDRRALDRMRNPRNA